VAVAREQAKAASSNRVEDLDAVLMVLGAGMATVTGGTPRTLVQRSAIATFTTTHLTYDVL
jgi:hypothetical protein